MKITITNDQGEVYVVAKVSTEWTGRDDVLLEDEEGDLVTANQLLKDAMIWERENR